MTRTTSDTPPRKFFTPSLILRIILFLLTFMVIFTLSLATVIGYKINFSDVSLSPAGVIQANVIPGGSTVGVNGQALSFWSGNRANVTSGNYEISASKKGFLDWKTVVPMRSNMMWWANIRLIPTIKQVTTVKTYDVLAASYASPDRRWLLNQLNPSHYELVDLRPSVPVYYNLDFSALLPNSPMLEFYDWNLGNHTALFRMSSETGSGDFYSLNLNNRSLTNISADYPTVKFDQIKVADASGRILVVKSGNSLVRIDLSRPGVATTIVSAASDFQVLSGNQVVYIRPAPVGANFQASLMFYDHLKLQSYEIERFENGATFDFEFFHNKHNNMYYLAVYANQKFKLWSGDFSSLKPPKKTKLEEEIVIDQSTQETQIMQRFRKANPDIKNQYQTYFDLEPQQICTGGGGRFLVVDFGSESISAEDYMQLLRELRLIKNSPIPEISRPDGDIISSPLNRLWLFDVTYEMDFKIRAGLNSGSPTRLSESLSPLRWLDDEIIWENIAGTIRVKDYNGQNQHKLIFADSRFDIQLSPNNKFVYFFQTIKDRPTLRRLNMIELKKLN